MAAALRDKESKINEQLKQVKEKWKSTNTPSELVIGEDEICDVISDWTGIPVKKLAEQEQEKLRNMENILHERVVGQDEAVTAVAKAIRRGRVGLRQCISIWSIRCSV